MTASAAAAREATGLAGLAALGVILAGGLVEGTALGILQGSWMARTFPGVSRACWILTTILVAGIGWSLASAPSTLGGSGGEAPPVLLMLTGAAALGAVMGALMGATQALVLRGHVRHPWRWISISTAAWTPTMVIIFAGATLPDTSWGTGSVVALGAATGLLAGGTLGAISIALLATLNGQSVWSGLLVRLLRRNLFGLGRTFALLQVTGVVTGRSFEFPVQYARSGDIIIVFPGGAARKTWWRNLENPAALSIWIDGGWQAASGRVVHSDEHTTFDAARAVYTQRWPSIRVGDQAPLVRIELTSQD